MLIRDLFRSNVTRDIPPVVYFHEQSPEKLATEVAEYIITGGWPEGSLNHRRVPNGIHEQYVHLLTSITAELGKSGGPDLPNVWISGFYGSGKSSFAKLLGLALDGVALPDKRSLADALLKRDTSPGAAQLRAAWDALKAKVEPMAVVFDIGGVARDNEHIHAAAVRQVQRRLGYCATEPLVADFELTLERDGDWDRFEAEAKKVLGRPWAEVKDRFAAEEDFSHVLSVLHPERYTDPMSWYTSRGGTHARAQSPQEAVDAIHDMLRFRAPRSTLFLVIDEVSQYVLTHGDRVERLRAFAEQLGARLKGKAWLLALGQQRIEEAADASFLVKTKDRFPPQLRVHLANTNIRDVVHKRLLQKKPEVEPQLLALFEAHRPDLKLYAYGCEAVTGEDFVEVYPMLPGQIDLILQITSALRSRSSRAQGDDQAIRGLLQLLGELFRTQRLAEAPVGQLVTLDQVYEVQHTALDSDVQASMARVLAQCADDASGLMVRAAKAVALLELIQDTVPTDARLVAQCLYERVDLGNNLAEVTEALEALRRRNLLGYSEKLGYKVQSSAGEEWEGDRRNIGVSGEQISERVQDLLKYALAVPELPKLQGRPFKWSAVYSDGRRAEDVALVDPRDAATVKVDLRLVARDERTESAWVKRSDETALKERLLWLAGDAEAVVSVVRELMKSQAMVRKYDPRRESLTAPRRLLLEQEKVRAEDLEVRARAAVEAAWMAGRMYFRGRGMAPADHGASFAQALGAAATRVLPELYPQFVATQVLPSELMQLLEPELSGPSPKFLMGELGILELDAGRYVPACGGVVPLRVKEHIKAEGGLSGTSLLARFGGPPNGYTPELVKACVAGLLRAGKLRVVPEAGSEITAVRDAGVRELFEKDKAFKRASFFLAEEDDVGPQARARICKFFEEHLKHPLDREDHAIADAVAQHFPALAQKLRTVELALAELPGQHATPSQLVKLQGALEACIRTCRQTRPTVQLVKRHLDTLRDGVQFLLRTDAELTEAAIAEVRRAQAVLDYQARQLAELGVSATNVEAAATRVAVHLASERPWREVSALEDDLQEILRAYTTERQRLLQRQEEAAEAARARVKLRSGFSTLTADQNHRVLRPLGTVLTATDVDAVAPSLSALKGPFDAAVVAAEEEANEVLDDIIAAQDEKLVVKVDLQLKNRELRTEAEVEAVVEEIRARLLERVKAGARVRLV